MKLKLSLKSPYDRRVVAEVEPDAAASIDLKLQRARAAFQAWREVDFDHRIAQVTRAVDVFQRDRDEIAREISLQMGKPITEALREVDTFLDRARYCIRIAPLVLAPESVPSQRLPDSLATPEEGLVRRVEHHPLGVVFDIAAWNYPLLLPVNVVVPAVLAGNAVLLKHSDKTLLSGKRFEQAFAEMDVEHVVQNLIVDHDQAGRIISDPRIDHLAFTGSVRGGHDVYRNTAAMRFIDAGLELGGKDAAYVAADADLEYAVAGLVDGACYNAGQSCCSVERIYVHQSVYDRFIDHARVLVNAYQMGDPLDPGTTMGPMASASKPVFLAAQVEEAVSRGARLTAGGAAPDHIEHGRRFFTPTLVVDVPNDTQLMQEESFGPIVAVAPVQDDDQAFGFMNHSRYGLTASVWTADQDRAEAFARKLDVGTVYQNRCDYLDPALPWTGVRDSGKGSSLSAAGFFHVTRRKSINFRTRPR
ncbi:aldehyde dehydrogenase family protein [Haliangium sp.]|uniref:aldehyde dehydrogenase family protein n=1 Tax=Haliangium sp. TaxID=2663208 RepID=UPI003D142C3C